jgi:hypothetical protein
MFIFEKTQTRKLVKRAVVVYFQVEVYTTCVEKLIEGALKGYNATVLAYGQVRKWKFE